MSNTNNGYNFGLIVFVLNIYITIDEFVIALLRPYNPYSLKISDLNFLITNETISVSLAHLRPNNFRVVFIWTPCTF